RRCRKPTARRRPPRRRRRRPVAAGRRRLDRTGAVASVAMVSLFGLICLAGGATRAVAAGSEWRPAPGTTWQWQLSGTVDTSVEAQVYDIDLLETPQETINALHFAGRKVICYFSAGAYEVRRTDADTFPRRV